MLRPGNPCFVGLTQFDLPESHGGTHVTCRAPDLTRAPDGTWQMFLAVVPGIFTDWNHPRDILQLTSTDMTRIALESLESPR